MAHRRIPFSRYGGTTSLKGTASGFFHVEILHGSFWYVDPDGCAFFAVGTCRSQFPEEGRRDRISWFKPSAPDVVLTKETWYRHTAERLAGWGFNWDATGDNGASPTGVHTAWIDASYGFGLERGKLAAPGIPHYMTFVDIFDPAFAKRFDRVCRRTVASRKNDPWLAGYFTDNELFWGWGWYPNHSVFDAILFQDPSTFAKREFVRFFRERYRGDLAALNEHWETRVASWDRLLTSKELNRFNPFVLDDKRAWLYHWAHTYFRITGTILKKHDPNHLNLGCRIHGNAEREVVLPMGEFVDVISYNKYDNCSPVYQIEEMFYRWAKRPVMVSEWGFRAEDAGLPNTGGVGRLVKTQDERGRRYAQFLEGIARSPWCIGSVWYAYVDDPIEGTKDALLPEKTENSNYGLVNERDEPYEAMIRHVAKANCDVYRQRLTDRKADPKAMTIVCPKDFFREPVDRFFVQRNGRVSNQEYLRAFLRGIDAGIDCQPLFFEMDFDAPVRFAAWVYQVENNAVLEFQLDGKTKCAVRLPSGPGKGVIDKKMPGGWQSVYDREFSIAVPKGRHSVRMHNAGKGWIWMNAYKVYR